MKPLKIFSALVAIALAVACSKGITDAPEPTPPSDPVPPVTSTDSIVTVSFTTGGEVVIGEEPLTKTTTSPDDLWGFQVYQYPDSVMGYSQTIKGTEYLCGYYDNLDSIKIPLVKGKWYGFTLTYIPNGKNEIKSDESKYSLPFTLGYSGKLGVLNNKYYGECFTHNLHLGCTRPRVGTGIYFSSIERYQGTKWNVYATNSTTTIGINLYRMMTGVKIVAEDFTSGAIYVKGANSTGNLNSSVGHVLMPAMDTIVTTRDTIMQDSTVVTLSDTIIQVAKESVLDITVQTPIMPAAGCNDSEALAGGYYLFSQKIMEEQPFRDEHTGCLQVVYKDTTGVEVSLYSNNRFEFKRLTKHVLKINVSDILNKEAGFKPEIKDSLTTPMPEEEVLIEQ